MLLTSPAFLLEKEKKWCTGTFYPEIIYVEKLIKKIAHTRNYGNK